MLTWSASIASERRQTFVILTHIGQCYCKVSILYIFRLASIVFLRLFICAIQTDLLGNWRRENMVSTADFT